MRSSSKRRARNPRGQGDRLRDEIVAAALGLVDETGSPDAVTLRAVARRAGITAPSIYAHFPERLAIIDAAVVESFAALSQAITEATGGLSDPVERLHAGCRGYLRFAADRPQRYALLFSGGHAHQNPDLVPGERDQFSALPGANAFGVLVNAITECVAAGRSASTDPFVDASAVWAGLHGYATLRMGVDKFPWPDDDVVVDILIDRLARVAERSPSAAATSRGAGR